MAKKQKPNYWKIATIIFAILAVYFMINSYVKTSDYNNLLDQQENPISYNYEKSTEENIVPETQTTEQNKRIIISGSNQKQTIDNNFEDLIIAAQNSIITISKESNFNTLIFSGINNMVYLCEGIHQPKITYSGSNNQIEYKQC